MNMKRGGLHPTIAGLIHSKIGLIYQNLRVGRVDCSKRMMAVVKIAAALLLLLSKCEGAQSSATRFKSLFPEDYDKRTAPPLINEGLFST